MPNQIAVVVGAGSGIGRATVRQLAAYGFDLALFGRSERHLFDALAEIKTYHTRTLAIEVDVTDPEQLDAATERVEEEIGPITVWVNAAGVAVIGPVLALRPNEISHVMRVNYLGSVFGTQAALRVMRRRGKGVIINVGLSPRLLGIPMQSATNAAHVALSAFCECVRPEIRAMSDDIKLVMVHLPSVNTARLARSRNRSGHNLRPIGRVYDPEVAAYAICRAIFKPQREIFVGANSIGANLARTLVPSIRENRLARSGLKRQIAAGEMTSQADAFDRSLPTGDETKSGGFRSVAFHERGRKPLLLTHKRRILFVMSSCATFALFGWIKRRLSSRRIMPSRKER